MPRSYCLILLLLVWTGVASAQEVEVAAVRFMNVRAPTGSNGTWMEADVQLTVRPAPSAPRDIVSRVRVTLLIGFELPAPAGGERRIEHYRADAEAVGLEAGRADVRFYLPPELVKRDQLHADPKYWGVEIAVAGRAVPAGRSAYSPNLSSAEQRKNFQTRGGAAAAPNEGLLQPQYLTPFVNEYPRATPSFVRREPR
jgi:hypothetical protein